MKKTLPVFSLIFLFSGCSFFNFTPSKKIGELVFSSEKTSPAFLSAHPDTSGNLFLRQMREENGLTDLVKNAKNGHEKVLLLLNWTRKQWEHHPTNRPSKPDALTILKEVREGQRFRCVEYGTVLKTALQAIGMRARTVGLKTRDVEKTRFGAGHVLTEVWLDDLKKWALVDGQFDVMPILDGTPLNCVELQAAIFQKKPFKFVNLGGEISADERKRYLGFIPHYLYFFDTNFDHRPIAIDQKIKVNGKVSLMLVPNGATGLVFQRNEPIDHVVHTHSVADFYAQPK